MSLKWAAERSFRHLERAPLRLHLSVEAGTLVEVELFQYGSDVIIEAELDDRPLWQVDGWTGGFGSEVFRGVFDRTGDLRLTVRAHPAAVTGFGIWIDRVAVRPASDEDVRRQPAEAGLWRAVERRRRGESGVELPLLQARRRFDALGDRRRAGEAGYHLARALSPGAEALEVLEGACADLRSAAAWLELGGCLELQAESLEALEGQSAEGLESRSMAVRRQALEVRRKGLDWFGFGVTANNLALQFRRRGEIDPAIAHFRKAIRAFRRVAWDPEVAADRAAAQANLGRVLLVLRNYSDAQQALDGAIVDWQQAGAEGRRGLFQALVDRSILRAKVGTVEGAQNDLEWAQGLLDSQPSSQAETWLNAVGLVTLAAQDFAGAAEIFGRALAVAGDGLGQAWILNNLGQAQLGLGDHASAAASFALAKELFRRWEEPWVALIPAIGELQARDRMGDPEITALAESLVRQVEEQRLSLVGYLDLGAFLALRRAPYEIAIHSRLDQGDGPTEVAQAWALVEQIHGRLLEDLLSGAALRDLSPSLVHAYRQRLSLALEDWSLASRDPRQETRLEELEAPAREALKALLRADRKRRPSGGTGEALSADDIEQRLSPDTALLTFDLSDTQGLLWIQTSQGLHLERIAERDRLEPVLESLYAALSSPGGGRPGIAAGIAQLRQMLLAPAAELLARYPNWLIMADGSLQRLPFEMLASGFDAPRGSHSGPTSVRRIHSAASWLALEERRRNRAAGSGGLLIGDPVTLQRGISELRGTRVELFGSLPWMRAGETYHLALRGDARAALLEGPVAGQVRFIQIAAHAMVNEVDPGLSRIALSPDPARPGGADLYAWQIYDLELRADLVILSGCSSGGGRALAGEGLLGLTHPFFVAGASQVLVSLWPVGDRGTARLLSRFHRHWSRGLPAAEALMRAKADLASRRDSLSHPFFWSGFVIYG
ncbi:MAG: CHAT domain-containing protein [Acidobacteriota bacterium]